MSFYRVNAVAEDLLNLLDGTPACPAEPASNAERKSNAGSDSPLSVQIAYLDAIVEGLDRTARLQEENNDLLRQLIQALSEDQGVQDPTAETTLGGKKGGRV